jgi:hypothetical protein
MVMVVVGRELEFAIWVTDFPTRPTTPPFTLGLKRVYTADKPFQIWKNQRKSGIFTYFGIT